MASTASPPPSKKSRLWPRQLLCEYSAYQCDRPCYLKTPFCDAHICEMQTLRSGGAPGGQEGGGETGGVPEAAKGVNTGQTASSTPPVIQCQYRVRRYERRCKNPVPADGSDVHFCSEHRARVATRRDGSAVLAAGSNPVAEAALKEALSTAAGAAPTTVSPAAVAEAVVSDYVRLPQRWLSSGSCSDAQESRYGLASAAGPGLPMPRAKDDEDKLDSIRCVLEGGEVREQFLQPSLPHSSEMPASTRPTRCSSTPCTTGGS